MAIPPPTPAQPPETTPPPSSFNPPPSTPTPSFLLPYLTPTSHILIISLPPCTTPLPTFLARHIVPHGHVTAVDLSPSALARCHPTTNLTLLPLTTGTWTTLPFPTASFDAVYAAQLMTRLLSSVDKIAALAEMRRVVRTGGVVATRDVAGVQFFPAGAAGGHLDALWAGFVGRVTGQGYPGGGMRGVYRGAGFDGGRTVVGAGTTVCAGRREVEGMVAGVGRGGARWEAGREKGVGEGEMEGLRGGLEEWAAGEGAWFLVVDVEVVGIK
ncbi:hypothetical protein QBC39DRAFT_409917 [Podospora conica]|nr:hypothetical protein QBC39DRAFT_409917 [Schizothecium conicum]